MTDLSTRNDFCVYIHTSPSGKSYVGQTCGNPKRRWAGGYGYRSNKYFWAAIQKYGWDSFEHTIVAKGLNQDNANFLEKQFIRFLCSDDRRFGYNIQEGGRSAGGMSPESYERMVALKRSMPAPNARPVCAFDSSGTRVASFGSACAAARAYGITSHAITEHLTKGRGTCCGMMFKYADEIGDIVQLPPDQIYKPHEKRSIRGGKNRLAKAVNVYDLDGTFIKKFDSCAQAASYLGVARSTAIEAANRCSGTCGGKIIRFSTGDFSNLPLDAGVSVGERPSRRKRVCQYDANGSLVNVYDSITQASEAVGASISAVSLCLRGKSKTCRGYGWEYDV